MVYRFKGFQEPEIVRTGQNLQVFMNDFETTAFLNHSNATQTDSLKLMDHRTSSLILPNETLEEIIPYNYEEAIDILPQIHKIYLPLPKIQGRKKCSLKEFKKRLFSRKIRKIKQMALDKYSVSYICATMNVKKTDVALIKKKIKKNMVKLDKLKVGRPSKFQNEHYNVLEDLLKYKPNGYLTSKLLLLKWLNLCNLPSDYITVSAFRNILHKKFRFTYKKNSSIHVNTNWLKYKNQRVEFILTMTKMIVSTKKIIFIDEVGFNLEGHKNYGWCKKGEKLQVPKTLKSTNYSLIGATSSDSFIGCMILKGSTNSEVFCAFMSHLISYLEVKGYSKEEVVFVLDHAKCHKKHLISFFKGRFDLIWTASYSPQLNPIELFWSHLKRLVYNKESYRNEDDLIYNISKNCFAINNDIVRSHFIHTLRFYEKALYKEDF